MRQGPPRPASPCLWPQLAALHAATAYRPCALATLRRAPQLWEGFETGANNIVVLGATNKKESLDDAVLRRFSLQYEVCRGAHVYCHTCVLDVPRTAPLVLPSHATEGWQRKGKPACCHL